MLSHVTLECDCLISAAGKKILHGGQEWQEVRLDGGRADLHLSAHEPELGAVCVVLSGLEGSLVGEFQFCMNCSV